jgi:hypothetical protein
LAWYSHRIQATPANLPIKFSKNQATPANLPIKFSKNQATLPSDLNQRKQATTHLLLSATFSKKVKKSYFCASSYIGLD